MAKRTKPVRIPHQLRRFGGKTFVKKYIPIPQSAIKKGMNPAISTGLITLPPG